MKQAGFLRRAGALIIDIIVLSIIGVIVGTFLQLIFDKVPIETQVDFFTNMGLPEFVKQTEIMGSDKATHTPMGILAWELGSAIWVPFGFIYFSIMESSNFQATVGKLLTSIKVGDNEGNKLSFAKALLRNSMKPVLFTSAFISMMIPVQTLKYISYVIFVFSVAEHLASLFTKNKQALHDIYARSYLFYKPSGTTFMGMYQ